MTETQTHSSMEFGLSKKLARISVSSYISLDENESDDEGLEQFHKDLISDEDTIVGHSRKNSVFNESSGDSQQTLKTLKNYEESKKSMGNKALRTASLVVNEEIVKRNLKNVNAAIERKQQLPNGRLVNQGEIVSFYVKKKNPKDAKKKTVKKQVELKRASYSEEVVLLETSDPDFFYSLQAKDKFGRPFEMEEFQDKIVLVKLKDNKKKKQLLLEAPPKIKTPTIDENAVPEQQDPDFLYSLSVLDKFGKDFQLSQLKGKVVIVVNTASKCKMAKQFTDLQNIYEKYKDQGLVILAFPTSQFGRNQELDEDSEILQFCKLNYGVKFPIMKKIKVNGKDEHILYKYLKNVKRKYFGLKSVTWNFEKFVIDRNGNVVKRSPSFMKPKSLIPTIEKLLLAKIE